MNICIYIHTWVKVTYRADRLAYTTWSCATVAIPEWASAAIPEGEAPGRSEALLLETASIWSAASISVGARLGANTAGCRAEYRQAPTISAWTPSPGLPMGLTA